MTKFETRIKKFIADRAANVGVMFALAAVPVVLAAGVAVDYARASSASSEVQAALDTAAVAAAASTEMTDPERIKLAKDMFARNFDEETSFGFSVEPVVTIVNDQVKMTVDMQVPMTLMKLAGINNLDFTSTTEIGRAHV